MKHPIPVALLAGIFLTLLVGHIPFIASAASVGASVNVIVIPDVPTNLSAAASTATTVDLSWTDASNNETGFSVERSIGNDTGFLVVGSTGSNITVYHDTTALGSTLYYYRIAATSGAGNSGYSNEASATTPAAPLPPPPPPPSPPPSSGGAGGAGGGGAGGAPVSFSTGAIFKGIAYPASKVTLLENAQAVATTEAGPDANFEVDLSNLAPGTYNFGVWAEDPSGNRSLTQTFSVTLTEGATTVISGIFFAPTIGTDKVQVKQGGVVTIFGYAMPSSTVTVMVHSTQEIAETIAPQANGSWFYKLNTDALALGDHTAQAKAQTANDVTTDSAAVTFTVGDEDVAAPPIESAPSAGDINGDDKVDLVDFSVMAYWYGRSTPPSDIDLNHDGKVDLIDFSILAYYWTG